MIDPSCEDAIQDLIDDKPETHGAAAAKVSVLPCWWRIQMRRLITTIMFLMLGSVAMAQTAGTGTSSPPSSGAPLREAPVGHRQPRADQVPSEQNLGNPNDPINKEDAALDRKIKSICRGC
jgi:hypothetical protein